MVTLPIGTVVAFEGYRNDGKQRKGEVVPGSKGCNQPKHITLLCHERSTPDNAVYRTYEQRQLGNMTIFARFPAHCPV